MLGPSLFSLTPLGYLAFACSARGWFLYRTRAGLVLRSVGESPAVAHSVGFPVIGVRYGATLFGGGMAGLAGGYYSIVYLHIVAGATDVGPWLDRARARRVRDVAPGASADRALLFGAVTGLQFYAQAIGVPVPTQFLAMLPYIATIVVLVLISRNPEHDQARMRLLRSASRSSRRVERGVRVAAVQPVSPQTHTDRTFRMKKKNE